MSSMRAPPLYRHGQVKWLRIGLGVLILLAPQVHAVITFFDAGSRSSVTMTVGSPQRNRINSVDFTVTNSNLRQAPAPVTGIPSSDTPATTVANGVSVTVEAVVPWWESNTWNQLDLHVDSSVALSCVAGSGCGSTLIPFSEISWRTYNKDAQYANFEIQDGRFDGSSNQKLFDFSFRGGSLRFSNDLVFSYDNDTLYPAGHYRGQVTYTVSMP